MPNSFLPPVHVGVHGQTPYGPAARDQHDILAEAHTLRDNDFVTAFRSSTTCSVAIGW